MSAQREKRHVTLVKGLPAVPLPWTIDLHGRRTCTDVKSTTALGREAGRHMVAMLDPLKSQGQRGLASYFRPRCAPRRSPLLPSLLYHSAG